MMKRVFISFLLLLPFFSGVVHALDLSGTNFILRDPLSVIEGGHSTSTNFRFFSSTGQTVIGQGTTTNFIYRSGFLYFPVVTSPVLSAAVGNGEAALSWTAATAALGFTVTNYQVGAGTTSGGPYDYGNVGNVLSYTKTGLTNGTTYFFLVRALDALGDVIATSTQVAAQPTNPGGGGELPVPTTVLGQPSAVQPTAPQARADTTVVFRGFASPESAITLLKDGQKFSTGVSDREGNFTLELSGLTPGRYVFAIYATDSAGRRSLPITFFVTVIDGKTTVVEGLFIGPTIEADKIEVTLGEEIIFSGETVPGADVTIFVSGESQFLLNTRADARGQYQYRLPTGQVKLGEYAAKIEARFLGSVSALSRSIPFTVGHKTVFAPKVDRYSISVADLNGDGKVDLIDFSMLLFWFGDPAPLAVVDFDHNGKVDLSDFSILIYYWTG